MNEVVKETNVKELDCMSRVRHFTQKEIKGMSFEQQKAIIKEAIQEAVPYAQMWCIVIGRTCISRIFGCVGEANGFFCGNDGEIQHYLGSEKQAMFRFVWELANKKIKFIEFNGKAV